MSDKVELIAAAQINAFGPDPSGIEFNSNFGFKTATRSSPGVYDLELEHEHTVKKLVVLVTRLSVTGGEASASLPSKRHVQVNLFTDDGTGGDPGDSPFFIQVWRIRD